MAGAVEGARAAELLQCGISFGQPCIHASPAVLVFRRAKQRNRSIFRQFFATAVEPEPLIINH
jgi:hypothetical protein